MNPVDEPVTFDPIMVPQYGPTGQVVGHMRMEFGGTIRRCQPYAKTNSCPSCLTVKGPIFTVGRFNIGKRPHRMTVEDSQFVQRTCRNCGMVWRELNTTGRT